MPVLTLYNDRHYTLWDGWQWAPRTGHPAQSYGEPYPDTRWIVRQVQHLWRYRQAHAYAHADAIRQWLQDYGMVVEYDKNVLRVKW